MLTQIYEVSTPGEARAIAAIGIAHIGILVGNGEFPRELPLGEAVKVASAVPPPARVSALFLTADVSLIEEWAARLGPAIVHLGAAPELLSPDRTAALKRKLPGRLVMRSIPVVGEESPALARAYEGVADFLLLDSHRESDRQIGALGVTHDWRISRRIVDLVRTPVILAGGLGPGNVADAIRAVRPAGVDSKTKTDRPGSPAPGSPAPGSPAPGSPAKDLDRVRRFHDAAQAAAASLSPVK
jgi:phosphoribosylanthranilate isomerase